MNRGFASPISAGVATLKVFCAANGVSLSTGAARSFLSATRDLLSFPALLGHREGKVRLRPAARRCSASRLRRPSGLGSSRFRAPSKKAHLGTWEQPSLASVPAECPE